MRKLAIGLLLLLLARLVGAQDSAARLRDLEEKLRQLEQRVEALAASSDPEIRKSVQELKLQIDAITREIETLKSGVPARKEETPGSAGTTGLGPAASRVYRSEHGVSIGGYGEALYQNFERRDQNGAPSGLSDTVDLERAVFYFGYKFDDRFLFNSEIEYEHATTGEGSEERGEVSVEFAYLEYSLSRSRRIAARAGLLLLPIGFINELHEPPIFLGSRRPEVETRILPSTWSELGLGVAGEAGPVAYRAYLVNGLDAAGFSGPLAIREGRQEGSNARAEDFAFTGRLDYTGLPGLVAGVSGYTGGSAQGRVADGRAFHGRVSIFEAHAEWRWRGIQARALTAYGRIGDAGEIDVLSGLSGTDSVPERFRGSYAEAGYDLLFSRGGRSSLVPFVRYERFNTQDRVPAGFSSDPANDVTLWTFGANYRPIPQIVLKADFDRYTNRARTGVNQWNVAVGWLF